MTNLEYEQLDELQRIEFVHELTKMGIYKQWDWKTGIRTWYAFKTDKCYDNPQDAIDEVNSISK